MMIDRVLGIVMLLLVGGCAAPPTMIEVNGYQLEKEPTERAFAEIKTRAAFELECPKEQLKLTVLREKHGSALHVGVMGCDRRGVYVRSYDRSTNSFEWLMNTATE